MISQPAGNSNLAEERVKTPAGVHFFKNTAGISFTAPKDSDDLTKVIPSFRFIETNSVSFFCINIFNRI